MQFPGLVILGVLVIGAVFVVLPVALTTLAENRHARAVRCPEAGTSARVHFDPARAARGALVGRVWLSVADCSLWPERGGCGQACTKAPAAISKTETAA
jgi:hypothetical protein